MHKVDVATSIDESMSAFRDIVWPKINGMLGGGRLVAVEGTTTDSMRKDLDRLAGIDAWQLIDRNSVMRGIGSRVQWNTDWKSFSIRSAIGSGGETEIHKRMKAINNRDKGFLFPHLTIQAYVRKHDGVLLSAGVARTVDLFEYIAKHPKPTSEIKRNPIDGNEFIPYYWRELMNGGVEVHVWNPPVEVTDSRQQLLVMPGGKSRRF